MKRISIFGFLRKNRPPEPDNPLRLNLGCGQMHLQGWVNIDVDRSANPDLLCDFLSLKNHFETESVDEILMLHSISYLRLWEARIFLQNVYQMLRPSGVLVLEFPDLIKCAKVVQETEALDKYLEGVRGIYAFDMEQIRKKEAFVTYAFGWSGWHMKKELLGIGFTKVKLEDPETHDKRAWRDTRVVAIK